MDAAGVRPQHYAFLAGDEESGGALARLQATRIAYFTGPGHEQPGEINHRRGGAGACVSDPDGHNWELLTRE